MICVFRLVSLWFANYTDYTVNLIMFVFVCVLCVCLRSKMLNKINEPVFMGIQFNDVLISYREPMQQDKLLRN